MTMQELARRSGISRATLYRWLERGTKNADPFRVRAFLEFRRRTDLEDKAMTETWTENCPECGTETEGQVIPESRHESGPVAPNGHIVLSEFRTVAFKCPDCGQDWTKDLG